MVMEDALTLRGGQSSLYIHHVSYDYILETCMILLTDVTPRNVIKNSDLLR